jgi:hypothetical protein
MKKFLALSLLLLISHSVRAQWLEDSILNDRNTVSRTGYTNARGIVPYGNNVYAVWTEAGYRIFLRPKVNGVWLPSEEVSVGSPGGIYGTSTYPCIALHNGEIHVVWEDYRTADFEIFYRRFSGGWGSPINLSGDTAQSRNAVIAVTNSGRRFLVWQDNRSGSYEIYAKIYENGTWGASQKLSSAPFYAGSPTLCGYNESVYLVWEELENNGYELYFSTHSGGTWSSPQRITSCEGLSLYPSLCMDPSGTAHLVFTDDRYGNFNIFYKRFDGSTWSAESLLIQGNPGEALYPQITADPFGNLHLVWSGNSEGNYEIFYRRKLGAQWSPDTILSFTDALSSAPHIAATTDGSIHVMWYDWVDDPVFISPHIRYRRYQATINLLSQNLTQEILSHGARINAYMPEAELTLFRIEEPFPIAVPPYSVRGDTVNWYDELLPGDYRYVVQIVQGTEVHYSHFIEVAIPAKPEPLHLSTSPNPFTTEVRIQISEVRSDLTPLSSDLCIYDVAGRKVREISLLPFNLSLTAYWDGRDEEGKMVKPGVYFIRYHTDLTTLTQKVIKF